MLRELDLFEAKSPTWFRPSTRCGGGEVWRPQGGTPVDAQAVNAMLDEVDSVRRLGLPVPIRNVRGPRESIRAFGPVLVMLNKPSEPDLHALSLRTKAFAQGLGFDLVGICSAEPSSRRAYFSRWIHQGQSGTMAYLADRFEERTDPTVYLPDAKSVICVALNYHVPLTPSPSSAGSPASPTGRIARYALGRDYHDVIKLRLYDLADWFRQQVPGAKTRCGVDTVPVMEKELAVRAGIGWMGKNTCIIHPEIGSWTLLGEVLTTVALPPDAPQIDRCGSCRRCIDACPTGAITVPYQLDARRCISYLTIEHAVAIDPKLKPGIGEWVFGCDICQEVCPYNSDPPTALDPVLQPRFADGRLPLTPVLDWPHDHYPPGFSNSAIKRVKLPVLRRNARIVAANTARCEG